MSRSQEILIVAGEVSGDIHAAPVVRELKKLNPNLTFFGAGGDQMRAESVELLAEVNDLAVMGFSQIPKLLPRLSRLKKSIVKRVVDNRVKLAILVDYPGFNLNLAKALKALPNPPKVLCYIAPQVWAWRKGRIKKMQGVVDHLAVVFPFEVPLFENSVATTFVGHPLVEELRDYMSHAEPDQPKDNSGDENILALLPGSRRQTMTVHLPIMVEAARRLQKTAENLQIGVGKAPGLDEDLYGSIIGDSDDIILWDDSRKLLSSATAAAVCSGTATLEAALFGTPQVVVYHTSWINYHLIKRMIKLERIALVNIVAEKGIVPEVLQNELTADNLSDTLAPLLADTAKRSRQILDLNEVKNRLTTHSESDDSPSMQVAKIAAGLLE